MSNKNKPPKKESMVLRLFKSLLYSDKPGPNTRVSRPRIPSNSQDSLSRAHLSEIIRKAFGRK